MKKTKLLNKKKNILKKQVLNHAIDIAKGLLPGLNTGTAPKLNKQSPLAISRRAKPFLFCLKT